MDVGNKEVEKEQALLSKHLQQLKETGNYNFYELKIFSKKNENA